MDSIRYYDLNVNALNLEHAGDAKTIITEGIKYGKELDSGSRGEDQGEDACGGGAQCT